MKEELRSQIIEAFQYLATQVSKKIVVVDRISTNSKNFNRHFTTISQLQFKLKKFSVRISGGIAMLEGEQQSFEFRTDTIQDISHVKNEIELTLQITTNVYRKVHITIIKKPT